MMPENESTKITIYQEDQKLNLAVQSHFEIAGLILRPAGLQTPGVYAIPITLKIKNKYFYYTMIRNHIEF